VEVSKQLAPIGQQFDSNPLGDGSQSGRRQGEPLRRSSIGDTAQRSVFIGSKSDMSSHRRIPSEWQLAAFIDTTHRVYIYTRTIDPVPDLDEYKVAMSSTSQSIYVSQSSMRR